MPEINQHCCTEDSLASNSHLVPGELFFKRTFKILIVDDNMFNLYTLRSLLQLMGLDDKKEASDGTEAVEIVKENKLHFDVILTDLQMPIMNGYEATQRIRKIEEERNWIPAKIYSISGHVMNEHNEECEHSQLDGWTAKPVTEEFLERVFKSN